MDFGRAFSYAFQDPDWLKKVGLAAVIMLIPVVGSIVVLGWGLEITRRLINNETDLLPDWSNFGEFLSKGFQAFVVTLAYLLPSLVINICQQGIAISMNAAANSGNGSQQMAGVAGFAAICLSCLSIVFSIAAGFLIPAALGTLADTGQLGAAFRFNQIIGLVRSAPGPYLLQLLVVGVASLILIPVGIIVCIVGVLAVSAYLTTVSSHLTGQSYKIARAAQAATGATI